jgi:amino acid transporter, AAT family
MSVWFARVPAYVWIVVFGALLLVINLRSVGSYGRVEFWLSMIKLATIVAFILVGVALLTTGRAVPQYHAQGGFFPTGFWTPVVALTYAIYSFGGVEMVAVTTGESRSTKDIPRAVWMTFLILTFVYVGAIVILLGVMPWNRAGVSESPFVTTFRTIRIPHASGLMNFVVLTAALSGANATLYVASRMVFSLARTGWAPASLGRLNHEGSPRNAVLHSSFGILFALVVVLFAPKNAFRYMLGAAFTGMILSWLVSLAAHISFRRRRSPVELAKLPLRSPLGIWGSVFGFLAVTISLLQTWFHPLVNLWSGLALFGVLTFAFVVLRSQGLKKEISHK